jgi:hypothetical protein
MSNEINGDSILGKLNIREWDYYDLTEDAKLDKYAIDVEAERQAELMTKWLSLLHQAQALLAKAQGDLDYVEAELRIEAKRNGIDGIQKITDATIDSWLTTHPRRRVAYDAKVKAYASVQYLQNAKTVLDHKRDMIKVLDHLLVSGFYARPNVSSKSSDTCQAGVQQEVKSALTTAFNRRQLNDNGE